MAPVQYENVLSWASDIEEATLEQAAKASRLPFVRGHLALMPDAHIGMGATIGSVIPTQGAIIPSAVGVDIGCGVGAVETDLHARHLPDDLGALHSAIAQVVPAGVGKGHTKESDWDEERRMRKAPSYTGSTALTNAQVTKVGHQFGTLGSGNHFVEICLDERERVWAVLHSGSRGIGNQLATQHIRIAKALMQAEGVQLEDRDLAYFIEAQPEFHAYIDDMLWAQDYALANREAMMDAVMIQLWRHVGLATDKSAHVIGHEIQRINCHHNYTTREYHQGRVVWLTRKGAIRAQVGDLGVIPGSMGAATYIVRGLGNEASYHSCSHGAGRRLSRSAARRNLTVESLTDAMEGKSWNANQASALLDEHPDSYKDIDRVMADQTDLVEIEHTLTQVLNYKGT